MKKYFGLLPNVITLGATLLGAYSIVLCTRDAYKAAAILILSATVLDVMDGWTARMLNSMTRLGTVLDSISDFIAFCVAPAVLLYTWLLSERGAVGIVACGFLALCGGYRLVRFVGHAETTEKTSFTGLPTPASAVIVASGVWACTERSLAIPGATSVGLGMAFVLGVLMVSQIGYGSAKALLSSGRIGWLLALLAVAVLLVVVGRDVAIVLFALAVVYMLSGVFTECLGYVRVRRRGGTQ